MFRSLENKYMYLIWWAIFVFILPWDQEKIVVFNLIVFVYLIFFVLSSTIENTFEQKKTVIKETLTQNITQNITTLKKVLKSLMTSIITFNSLTLSIIEFYRSEKYSLYTKDFNFNDNVVKSAITLLLSASNTTMLKYDFSRNLFTVQFLAEKSKSPLAA